MNRLVAFLAFGIPAQTSAQTYTVDTAGQKSHAGDRPYRIRSAALKSAIAVALAFAALTCAQAQTAYTINTTTLNSFDGTHPRLLLDTAQINTIKNNITANPSGVPRWGEMWLRFKNNADATSMKIPPAYVTPGASDVELWQREVGDNISLLAFAYLLTKSTPANFDTFSIEAEDTPLTSPMTLQADTTVSGRNYISSPTGGAANAPTNTKPVSASYNFSTLVPSYYHVWARVYAPDASSNTFWLGIEGKETNNTVTTTGSWVWVHVNSFHLTPGHHNLNFTYQEQGLRVDKFMLTNDYTLTPTGLGTEQHWVEAEDFTLNANGPAAHPNTLLVTSTNSLAPIGDATAHGKKWLESWIGSPANGTTPVSTAVPDAQKTVGLSGGNYDVWVRFKSPYVNHDSFYFAIDNNGYSAPTLDGTSVFPFTTLVSPTLFKYNNTLGAPYNTYPYREWIWKKVATNVALAAGDHTLKVTNRTINGGANTSIDRFLVTPTGTAAPSDPNKYLAMAQKWALTSCAYPTWGTGGYATSSLSAAHELLGLSLFYDWCYSNLGLLDRATIANTLSTRGAMMNAAVPTVWWKNAFLQNHMTVCLTGLTAAGLAIHGDSGMPDTLPWLQTAMGKLNYTLDYLGADGGSHEGVAYWSYEAQFLLKYMDMSKKLMGADMFNNPWLQSSANYRLYFDVPMNSMNGVSSTHINFGDSPGYEWYGPDLILRKLAALYNIPTAQWQAQQYDVKNANSSERYLYGGQPWLNFLWYNPSIVETSPIAAALPNMGYFDDLDFVVARTGWDGNESVVAYQSGPFMGHGVQAKNTTNYIDWGAGHTHPAAGNFCIFGNGEWLLQNAGYTYKWTAYENSLLVNNVGQKGENNSITFAAAAAKDEDAGGVLNPAIDDTVSVSNPIMDYIVGNADKAYPTAAGVTKFRRHLLFLKPDVLVVVDDVALSASKPLELRFYPKQQSYTLTGSTYSTTGTTAKLNFNVLQAPAQIATTTKILGTLQGEGSNVNRLAYSLATTSNLSNLSTAVAFAWAPVAGTPKTVTYLADADGTAWKFKVGNQTMVLNRNATAQAPDEKARVVTTLETESSTPVAPMQTYSDATAAGGQYIATPVGTLANVPDTLTVPSAQVTFNVPAAGNFAVWARVYAPSSGTNTFYFAVNPTGSTTYTYKTLTNYASWIWVNLSASTTLSAGSNTVALKYGKSGCRIDQVIVTPDLTYTPYGIY